MSFQNFHPTLEDSDIDAQISSELVPPPEARKISKKFNQMSGDPVEKLVTLWDEPSAINVVIAKEGKSEKFKDDLGHYSVFISYKVTDGTNKGKGMTENLQLFPKTLEMTWEELRTLKEASSDGDPRRSWGWAKMQTIKGYQRLSELMIATGNRDRLTSGASTFRGLHTIEDLLDRNGNELKGLSIKVSMESGGLKYDGSPEEVIVTRIGAPS